MRVLRWLAAAFSIYSRIPMPRFEWRDGDASHSLIFFPAVGALTGSLVFLANSPFAAGFASIIAMINGWKWAYIEQGI